MKNHPTTKKEAHKIISIATPLVVAYLSELGIFTTTKIVVGKIGYQELAAVGISGHLSLEISIILIGLLTVIGVLCAQAEGENEPKKAGQAVRQGVFVSLLLGIPASVAIWNLDYLLIWTNQDSKIIHLSVPYIKGMSGFIVPALLFSVLRSFVSAIARPRVIMVITVAAVGMNYLFTMWFVYGGWGIPTLGLFGAGLATSVISWLMFFALLIYIYHTPYMRGYGIFVGRWYLCRKTLSEIFHLGIPVAGLVGLEAGLFMAVSLLAGVFGAATLAASEIVMAWISIPFMFSLGIAEATMVRVAYGVGRKNLPFARLSGFIGIGFGVLLLTTSVIIPIGFPKVVISIFISHDDAGYKEVLNIATQMLLIAAVFQIFDGMQAISARALRGIKDTAAPLAIAAFGYWVLGIGGGSLLAFYCNLQGPGLWWGLAAGLTTTGTLLTWRFHHKTNKMITRTEQ